MLKEKSFVQFWPWRLHPEDMEVSQQRPPPPPPLPPGPRSRSGGTGQPPHAKWQSNLIFDRQLAPLGGEAVPFLEQLQASRLGHSIIPLLVRLSPSLLANCSQPPSSCHPNHQKHTRHFLSATPPWGPIRLPEQVGLRLTIESSW